MSIRNLDFLFAPRSVAVFGATDRPHRVGAVVWNNLVQTFKQPLFAVNPRLTRLGDAPVYACAAELPQVPDLVVLCVSPARIPGLIAELGQRGTRAAVVIGWDMTDEQRKAMLQAAKRHTLRILGPRCIGLQVPHLGLNASFAHVTAAPGALGFVSQSGALVSSMLDWAQARGIGFSHCVALGERADVDVGDVLDYLGSDPQTRAILLYIETVESARKFMSAARAAARSKPVILVKAGRSEPGQLAVATHTRSLIGSDEVFEAAISRAGMLRVNTLSELFLAAEMLARFRDNRSDRLLVLMNGGAGVVAADAAAHVGVELAPLGEALQTQLNEVLPSNWSHCNPVDIIGDAPPRRYVDALQVLRQQSDCAVLLLHVPTALVSSTAIAQALLPVVSEGPPWVLTCWLGHAAVEEARQLLRQANVPDYGTPEEAVRAFSFLRQYHRHQAELMETPPASPLQSRMDLAGLRELIAFVQNDGREWLTEPEAKELLRLAGIPVASTPMVRLPHAHELMVGASIDPVFGPVILFGQGGTAVEVLRDHALALPPLNLALADALVERTRVSQLLKGYRDAPAADRGAINAVLVAVSQLLADVPELAELDINPLMANHESVLALGARVRVSRHCPGGAARFAIRPYPQELVETLPWDNGLLLTLRPIRPEDEAQHLAFFKRLEPEDIRMRVFYSRRGIEHTELARLTQIDYDREMAFIATTLDDSGVELTLGSARGICDPDNDTAEFGIIIRSDLKGKRLGWLLMDKLIRYLRGNGTRRVVGTVLRENQGMLGLASGLGFVARRDEDDPDVVQVELLLRPPA